MDKFALVYEFNNDSPLIVYKASKELEDNNIAKAIEMLNKAIEDYPYYPTPYFLLATALAYNHEFEEAQIMLSKAHNILDNEQTYKYYNNLIEKIKRESDGINSNFDDTVNKVLDETFLDSDELESIDLLSIDNPTDDNTILTKINTHLPDGTIVTETLAEIYSSQGNYNEAKEIYEKLKYIYPDKAEKFEKKILELSSTTSSKK
jgi:tetratricopeptide (TPR) repeat protein